MEQWHTQPLERLYQRMGSSEQGLSQDRAQKRLKEVGENTLPESKPPDLFWRLIDQLGDPMILILLGAAALSWFASGGKDWLDGVIILVIVAVNSILSILQEDHAQQALDQLRRMSAPQAKVVRQGREQDIPAAQLVPGDVIVVETGDQIPADARIIRCSRLQADESALTGESVPVEKEVMDALQADTPLGERRNLLLSGTWVTAGKGTALVVATGGQTEMGRLAGLLLEQERGESPLQRRMNEVSRGLSVLCLGVCGVMFVLGLAQGKPVLEMLLTAVSLAVAAIPEGLAAVVTIVLALGVQRLADRGAIVKKLPAVETLGCAGVICSDKTGTLTQNKMTVERLWVPDGGEKTMALTAGALCNDGILLENGQIRAEPTEGALLAAAVKEGMDLKQLQSHYRRVGEIPFDSNRKKMSTIHQLSADKWQVFVKGAPDVVLESCVGLSEQQRKHIIKANQDMADQALRVIAVATRELRMLPASMQDKVVEQNLTFLGLFGLVDPPRPEAAKAVARCVRAGIRPVMITGDHPATAGAIAKKLGILKEKKEILTGRELDFLPQKVLEEEVERFSVYARVTPEHKLRIVKAWQSRGQVVCMTGDGVNDAPALKAADMGCAMGQGGTDVARGAASMVLTDDDFSTIVQAVEEGRGVYANIKKAIHYLLSCNIGEVFTIFMATVLGFAQMPLVPVQLLWLNLVTDSLPALALGMERVEPGVMERPPRGREEKLFERGFILRLVWQGCMVGMLTLSAYFAGMARGEAAANTMAFATLTLSQLFHAFNVRSERRSLFSLGVFSNRPMNRAFMIGLALQLSVLLIPPLQGAFRVVALTGNEWITVLALAVTPIPVCEIAKLFHKFRT